MLPKDEVKIKRNCPECDKEVELTVDEDGDYVGRCGGCGLNVGRIATKRRLDRAYEKDKAREEKESENVEDKKKKKSGLSW